MGAARLKSKSYERFKMRAVKIGLVGAGQIGGWLAGLLLNAGWADVTLYDTAPGLAQGKALDLMQGLSIAKHGGLVKGSDIFQDLCGADILVVTAGLARQPGMSRDDLLSKNVAIFKEIARNIQQYTPNAFVIVVTNPLDVMVWVMQKLTCFATNKVIGMAGILDSGRFASFLSDYLNVCVRDIQTMVLGGHGDLMVPLLGHTSIQGIQLAKWLKIRNLTLNSIESLVERTRQGGAEIVNLLKKGSAYAAPAQACFQMIRAIVHNERCVVPCATMLAGEYGFKDVYAGVPVVLGQGGVEEVITLDLTSSEKDAFAESVRRVEALNTVADSYMKAP